MLEAVDELDEPSFFEERSELPLDPPDDFPSDDESPDDFPSEEDEAALVGDLSLDLRA